MLNICIFVGRLHTFAIYAEHTNSFFSLFYSTDSIHLNDRHASICPGVSLSRLCSLFLIWNRLRHKVSDCPFAIMRNT